MKTYTFRLKPAQDLFDAIDAFVVENKIQAGCVLSSVGSLTHVTLRLANRSSFTGPNPKAQPTDDAYYGRSSAMIGFRCAAAH